MKVKSTVNDKVQITVDASNILTNIEKKRSDVLTEGIDINRGQVT